MKEKWMIVFTRKGEIIHKEFDMHLVPRIGERVILPIHHNFTSDYVENVIWDYKKKRVAVKLDESR